MSPDYIVFTDASVKLTKNHHYSAYAAVVLNCNTMQYTVIDGPLQNRSICYCEGWAIFQGLRYMEHIRKQTKKNKLKILVVTDSKLNVQILTDWIQNKWDTSDWFHWKKKTAGEVQNQDLYRLIVKILNNEHFQVRLVHINSHSGSDSDKRGAIKAKLERNHVKLDNDTLDLFIQFNAIADESAHSIVRHDYLHPEDDLISLQYRA